MFLLGSPLHLRTTFVSSSSPQQTTLNCPFHQPTCLVVASGQFVAFVWLVASGQFLHNWKLLAVSASFSDACNKQHNTAGPFYKSRLEGPLSCKPHRIGPFIDANVLVCISACVSHRAKEILVQSFNHISIPFFGSDLINAHLCWCTLVPCKEKTLKKHKLKIGRKLAICLDLRKFCKSQEWPSRLCIRAVAKIQRR